MNRFGIKEVADVSFYAIEENADLSAAQAKAAVSGKTPIITFDTLKVSNIESTAENSEARGGKGNAALISWDYGREITVTLEDALLSMETLSLLFENSISADGSVTINANTFPGTYTVIGTTYARNESDGKDHLFTFIIPKAKIQSETTLTMEAEGDPTVIGMTLKVLRCKNGDMMVLERETKPYDANDTRYQVTFEFADGDTTIFNVKSGDTIAAPTNTTATSTHTYSWPTVTTTVSKSAYYKEVATAI
jgi:hypothetical protein